MNERAQQHHHRVHQQTRNPQMFQSTHIHQPRCHQTKARGDTGNKHKGQIPVFHSQIVLCSPYKIIGSGLHIDIERISLHDILSEIVCQIHPTRKITEIRAKLHNPATRHYRRHMTQSIHHLMQRVSDFLARRRLFSLIRVMLLYRRSHRDCDRLRQCDGLRSRHYFIFIALFVFFFLHIVLIFNHNTCYVIVVAFICGVVGSPRAQLLVARFISLCIACYRCR
mmetsp:Transcript_63902/g.101706  ORF Transcript_63902/g.101706 Transcript_63902/m.101706 type:complete len:224 (-) Transcript_63902:750-1421(-)